MIQHTQAANTRLLQNSPKGFALGGEHAPHVTVLPRYVNTPDLDKVYAAVGEVFAKENPTSWELKALKYDYIAEETISSTCSGTAPADRLLTDARRDQGRITDAPGR
jgi:hypothetical protein